MLSVQGLVFRLYGLECRFDDLWFMACGADFRVYSLEIMHAFGAYGSWPRILKFKRN